MSSSVCSSSRACQPCQLACTPLVQVDGTIEKRFAKKEVMYPMEVRGRQLAACRARNPPPFPASTLSNAI